MNFAKAFKELKNGERIRHKGWEPLMHMVIEDGKVITYKSESMQYYVDADIIISEGWKVKDGDGKTFNFVDALEELKLKKYLTTEEWEEENKLMYLFLDGENLALCKPIAFDFMPSFKELSSPSWEIMK